MIHHYGSSPSKSMMTLFSVAPVCHGHGGGCGVWRLAGPGTVRAWEETRIARSIRRCLSSFPGLLDLCAAPPLKCVHDVSGEGSPSSPVMSAGLKLLLENFSMACAGLYRVFESLERPSLLLLPRSELPKHQLLR